MAVLDMSFVFLWFYIIQVLQREMMQIRAGCEAVGRNQQIMNKAKKDLELGDRGGPYEPKITFLAVQKRHKTRLFVQNASDGVGRVMKFILSRTSLAF